MKRTKRSKLLAALLALSLVTGALGACGKGGTDDKTGGNSPAGPGSSSPAGETGGRYVETEVKLPPELMECSVAHMYAEGETLHLLALKDEDGKTRLQEWTYRDGAFTDVTRDWLAALALPGTDWVEARLAQDAEGNQYLYAGYAGEISADGFDSRANGDFKGHLWKGTAEGAVEITPEKWTVPDEEWGSYEMIQGMAALDNGTLAVLSYTSLDILSAQDGSVLESDSSAAAYDGSIVTDGENIYLGSGGSVEKRREGKAEGALAISLPEAEAAGDLIFVGSSGNFNSGGSSFLDVLSDGTLIAAGEKGIYRLPGNAQEGEWEQLAAGMDTDFSMSGCYCMGLAALENGGIYGLFVGDGSQKLNFYQYDPDAVSQVTQVLKLYTVYESSLLKQAAVLYHRAHPEVMIEIESEYPLYSFDLPDYDALYKKLNTRLMGEDAPDILVLDQLDIDTYARKGLLENLDDIVRPLEESGELLANITGTYRDGEGRRYAVPLQFSLALAMGRDISPENMGSLEALADFLSGEDYSYLGEQTVDELVSLFYPYFCGRIVCDKELDKETLSRYLEYLKAVADNCGIIAERPEEELAFSGMWGLASQAKLAIEQTGGFMSCMLSMGIVDYIKGDFTAFENSFSPSVQMGICTKGKYTETAKDFLRFALSEQVQDSEYNGGFPVNSRSLKKQAEKDRSNEAGIVSMMGDDGSHLAMEFKAFSKETAARLVALCEGLDTPTREDAKIQEVLIGCLEGYLKGTQSLEETVGKIEDGLKMYLAE